MDTVFLALRVVVSLAVVLGAIWFVQKRVGRGGRGRTKSKPISVVARQSVGGKASVAVIDFGGKRFLLGVTEHAVSVLDSAEVVAEETVAEQNFAEALSAAEIVGATEVPALDGPKPSKASKTPAAPAVPAAPKKPAARKPAASKEPAIITPAPSRLSGSVLSASTWRQAFTALRGER